MYAQKAVAYTLQDCQQLEQEARHRAWLEQNIKRSNLVLDSRKKVLKLRTEQAYKKLQTL